LAAILAADVVGYSRLMGENEEGTLAALKGSATRIDRPSAGDVFDIRARVRARGKLAEILSFSRFEARRSGAFGALKCHFRCDLIQLSCQAAVPLRPSEGFGPFNSAFRHGLAGVRPK
jgi:hypothetical protein